jgi:prepilin peptidase CpaA
MITSATAAIATSLAVTACALAWAAVSDFLHYIIPNRTPIIVTMAYGAVACFMPLPFLIGGAATGLGVFAVGAFLFARGWMGGGDVKLIGAVALWAGPSLLSHFAVATCLAGTALALVILSPLGRRMPLPSPEALGLAGGGSPARQPMPFGVAIAAGGLFVLARYLPLLA